MPRFTITINTEAGTRDFIFNRIFTVDGPLYYISVKNSRDRSEYFHMIERRGMWTFRDINKVPEWIMPLESKLADAINEH
jgi:hypothetical protein